MTKIAVMVSGGGTNLQALIDAEKAGKIPHGKITLVIASNAKAYALERAAKAGIESTVVARKSYESQEAFDQAIVDTLRSEKDDHRILLSVYQSKVSGRNLNEIKSSTEELDIRSGALINRTSTENISNVEVYDILSRDDTNNYQYRSIGFIKDNKEYAFLFVSDDIDTFNKDINSFKSSLEFH